MWLGIIDGTYNNIEGLTEKCYEISNNTMNQEVYHESLVNIVRMNRDKKYCGIKNNEISVDY